MEGIVKVTSMRRSWHIIIVSCLLSLIALPCLVHSAEREIVLKEYETKKEQERMEERKLKLDFSFGYGYSPSTVLAGYYDLDPRLQLYLNRLDLKFADIMANFRLTASYLLGNRGGIYIAVPAALVDYYERRPGQIFVSDEDKKMEFGLGDIYGGVFFTLIEESKFIPNLILNLEVNSNTSDYYPLGDGVWDFMGRAELRKLLTESFFIYVDGDYTYRMEKNDVKPGDIIGCGGGIGLLTNNRRAKVQLGMRYASFKESTVNDVTVLDKGDDLAANLTFAFDKGGFSFFITNLNHGFATDNNTWGMEFTFTAY